MAAAQNNARSIEQEIEWFEKVLDTRIRLYFGQECEYSAVHEVVPPRVVADESEYTALIADNAFDFDERLLLALILMPYVRPQILDTFFVHNKNFDRGFTEFGGRKNRSHGGFLPTCETAMFLLAGTDLNRRFECMKLFDRDHPFSSLNILRVEDGRPDEPTLSCTLALSTEWLNRLTTGITHKPDISNRFPAKLVTTQYTWAELVLPRSSRQDLEDIVTWTRHADRILSDWGFGKYFKPGFRCLFYGPPGTGKTLAATLVGKAVGADVYRIDLSMIVSKYVGETEKNLANVFDQAQNKRWILFFDEADALFGTRTSGTSANDRYSNQEISYLLQRVEDFPGTVILASNLRSNIDPAFTRRFQTVVHFPMPEPELRQQLWTMMMQTNCDLADDIDVFELANRYELAGGSINNAIRYAAIRAADADEPVIRQDYLMSGVVRELAKEGRTP